MKAKKEEAKELLKQVKKANLTAEQKQFLKKNNYQGTSMCIVLNATEADRAMINSISAIMDIKFINIVEPPDEPDELTNKY